MSRISRATRRARPVLSRRFRPVFRGEVRMRVRSAEKMPEALRRHNEEQQRDPEDVVRSLGRRVRVVVPWRERDGDPERWIYLERMEPHEFSLETLKLR